MELERGNVREAHFRVTLSVPSFGLEQLGLWLHVTSLQAISKNRDFPVVGTGRLNRNSGQFLNTLHGCDRAGIRILLG